MNKLQMEIEYCKIQAQWHLAEYQKFAHYLQHYENLLLQQHKQHDCGNSSSQFFLPPTLEQPFCNTETFTSELDFSTASGGRRRKKKKRKKKKNQSNQSNQKFTPNNTAQSESKQEQFEMDIKFCEFLKQSAEFRKQRDAEKQQKMCENNANASEEAAMQIEGEKKEWESVEYVDVMRKGPDGTMLPPTASTRKEVYEKKYGLKGTAILSLETALQWKYNKYMDTYSPGPWPSLQLSFR